MKGNASISHYVFIYRRFWKAEWLLVELLSLHLLAWNFVWILVKAVIEKVTKVSIIISSKSFDFLCNQE